MLLRSDVDVFFVSSFSSVMLFEARCVHEEVLNCFSVKEVHDLWSGSATVLVAVQKMQLKYFGFALNELHAAYCLQRLDGYVVHWMQNSDMLRWYRNEEEAAALAELFGSFEDACLDGAGDDSGIESEDDNRVGD